MASNETILFAYAGYMNSGWQKYQLLKAKKVDLDRHKNFEFYLGAPDKNGENGTPYKWVIVEKRCASMIGKGKTRKEALANANDTVGRYGWSDELFDQAIKSFQDSVRREIPDFYETKK